MDGNWGATVKNRILITTLAILTMGFFVSASALAGEYPDPDPDVPAPTQQPTSVARLSVVQGQVSTAHGDAGEWANGTMNTPLVPGDRVSSGDRSRAEIQIDPYNVMRLDERTEARMADLQSNKIQLQLASGLMEYSVLNGTQADVEIDTPNMGVHPLSPGLYRIQVTSDTDTMLIVRHGEAEVLTNQGSQKVEAGQMIQIRGTDNPEYKVDAAPGRDDFDHWSSDRDRQLAAAPQPQPQPQYGQPQPQYGQPQPPPSQITGSGELNNYGQWGEVPDYGWCWTPQVDAGWVPYSAGNWGYEPYFGWTWISSEPGVGRRTTMAAGSTMAVRGGGGPVRVPSTARGPCGRPLTSPSSAGDMASAQASALVRLAGWRLDRVTFSIPGTVRDTALPRGVLVISAARALCIPAARRGVRIWNVWAVTRAFAEQ